MSRSEICFASLTLTTVRFPKLGVQVENLVSIASRPTRQLTNLSAHFSRDSCRAPQLTATLVFILNTTILVAQARTSAALFFDLHSNAFDVIVLKQFAKRVSCLLSVYSPLYSCPSSGGINLTAGLIEKLLASNTKFTCRLTYQGAKILLCLN